MSDNIYEDPRLLSEYLLFHYGEDDNVLPYAFGPREALYFPQRCAHLALTVCGGQARRALDIGCAVGRSTFDLARGCDGVLGIDYSNAFIGAAQQLQQGEHLPYEFTVTASLTRRAIARAPTDINLRQVGFEVGDACDLRTDLGTFDLVLGANLLCRLPDPRKFLERLPGLVEPGGWVVFTSPNTWLEEFTPKGKWLAGTPEAGHPLGALYDVMNPAFTLQDIQEMPFLIREHARKFQWSVAQATVWQRRS